MAYEGQEMKLVVNLPDSLVGRIREAVEEGGYEDAREFVTVAIENQLELEEETNSSMSTDEFMTLEQAVQDSKLEEKASTTTSSTTEKDEEIDVERYNYHEIIPIADATQERKKDGPLWGQYNRILPVKFVLRRLANLLNKRTRPNQSEPVLLDLQEFEIQVAQEAREFGQELERADERNSRGRGEKFSAGFPTGDKETKSLDRFQSHFVGDLNRNGNLTGAPPALQFVDIVGNEAKQIGITEAGLKFTSLPNPVLDESVDATEPLSNQEKDFYIEHVEENLPRELEAMKFAAESIREGDNRPTSLTERIAELDEDWSEAQASTVRSGLVSRMYELGLVRRRRVGQRGIAYELTSSGNTFLERFTRD